MWRNRQNNHTLLDNPEQGILNTARAGLYPQQFVQQRRRQVEPIMGKLLLWLQERENQVPPSTTLGKAIGYAMGQWSKLLRYLDSPLPGS